MILLRFHVGFLSFAFCNYLASISCGFQYSVFCIALCNFFASIPCSLFLRSRLLRLILLLSFSVISYSVLYLNPLGKVLRFYLFLLFSSFYFVLAIGGYIDSFYSVIVCFRSSSSLFRTLHFSFCYYVASIP